MHVGADGVGTLMVPDEDEEGTLMVPDEDELVHGGGGLSAGCSSGSSCTRSSSAA